MKKTVIKAILPKSVFLWLREEYGFIKMSIKRKKSREDYLDRRIFVTLRKMNLSPFSKYKSLKKFRGIHKGKRCFIIGNGSSLSISDLDKLKNEITFGMNLIYRSFESTSWRPTYYLTHYTLFNFPKLIDSFTPSELSGIKHFFLLNPKRPIQVQNYAFKRDYSFFPKNSHRQWITISEDGSKYIPSPYKIKFSSNIFGTVYTFNIAYTALQVAAYMGFSEIYLLGCDVNWDYKKKNHFYDKSILPLPEDSLERTKRAAKNDNLILGYKSAKEYADKKGFKIYNATRGGLLEVFERVDFDEVLEK